MGQESVVSLPFNRFVGIQQSEQEDALVELPAAEHYLNHLGTVHAAAQLALAEACSGEFLIKALADQSNVVPVVRRMEAKFRKPAMGKILAKVRQDLSSLESSLEDLNGKGRCLLTICVDVYDEAGQHVLASSVEWFLTRVTGA